MNRHKVIQAIRDLYKEELLNTKLKRLELEKIDTEISHIEEVAAKILFRETRETKNGYEIIGWEAVGVRTIEHEIELAKIDGLKTLRSSIDAKGQGDLILPHSFIRYISQDGDIVHPKMVQDIVTAFLLIQNGRSRQDVLDKLKSSLAYTLIDVCKHSKRKAAEKSLEIIELHFDTKEDEIKLENTRKKGDPRIIDTAYGHFVKLP